MPVAGRSFLVGSGL